MDDAPAGRELAVDLGFAAMSSDRLAVFSEFGIEIPIKLGPGGVSVDVDGDVARRKLALGKKFLPSGACRHSP